jgi:hypothetical protein
MSPATMYIMDMERVISPMLDNFFKEKNMAMMLNLFI